MTKKTKKSSRKAMTAEDHHRMAATYHAKGSLHRAKAEVLEAQNPPKKMGSRVRPY